MLRFGLCQTRFDSEDADGSISCYGCETGLDRVTSKAVAAMLLAYGEAAIDLLQYVLFSVRTSEWMCYKEKCYCDVLFALRGALVLLQELVLNIENCCAIIARPLCCRVCKCKASFQRRQFRVTIDLGAAISIYSDASLFPGVTYLKSVAPIDQT